MRGAWVKRTAIMIVALCIAGCMFRKLDEQLKQIDELCVISGTVRGDPANRDPRVVLLLRATPAGTQPSRRIDDHFVSEGDGRWIMVAQPGEYALAAFEDRSRDLIYQPGEPVLRASETSDVHCERGSRIADRVRSPLRMYSVLELALVVVVLATPLTFRLILEAYRGIYPAVEGTAWLPLGRLVLAVLALAPATILMGATFPSLMRHLTTDGALSRSFGRLYAANTIGAALRTLGFGQEEMYAHGFRALASSLLHEESDFPSEVIERALGHQDQNSIRRAYARNDYWKERVRLAQWWADYLDRLRDQKSARHAA